MAALTRCPEEAHPCAPPPSQVVSKRVSNAKSERFYKNSGKKKSVGFWAVRGAVIGDQVPCRGLCSAAAARQPHDDPSAVLSICSQGFRKQLAAHPVVVALIFFIMVFSGEPQLLAGRRVAVAGGDRCLQAHSSLSRFPWGLTIRQIPIPSAARQGQG